MEGREGRDGRRGGISLTSFCFQILSAMDRAGLIEDAFSLSR